MKCINSSQIETSWEVMCGVKLMSPGGREVAPSGDEKEDAGPGLLTLPPLKERLPDVPKPPTKGTAERGAE